MGDRKEGEKDLNTRLTVGPAGKTFREELGDGLLAIAKGRIKGHVLEEDRHSHMGMISCCERNAYVVRQRDRCLFGIYRVSLVLGSGVMWGRVVFWEEAFRRHRGERQDGCRRVTNHGRNEEPEEER